MKLTRRQLLKMMLSAGLAGSARAITAPLFVGIPPSRSGISWVHENARSQNRYLPETMGPGCAFLDYDNDGWMDIYLVNSGSRNALYRNNRDGTFSDVTDKAGVAGSAFGMGIAVGDFDNDGWPDLFVTAYGNCILYRNNRNGTFTDVTDKAGLATPGWTTSAVWFDYDNDGKLDLFVCSYVDYPGKEHQKCSDERTTLTYYCPPRIFGGTLNYLYHNNGDGTFTEARKGTDIEASEGKALGVVAADLNNDGRMDLFVANDMAPNFLFMNRGRNFEEIALSAEVAYSRNGVARSGMGVDAADLFGSGYQDLFVANIDQEMYSLYRNLKNESFRDAAAENDLAPLTRSMSGWGLKFFDYDNDGALDLIIANGHPDDHIGQRSALNVSYEEPLLLFHQEGARLRHVPGEMAGPAFSIPYAARGLAVGDFNNDGLVDVLVTINGGAPVLLKNQSASGNHWLGLKLSGVTCNRDGIGAKIRWSAGGIVRSRSVNGGGSYLSAHDPRVVLGTGRTGPIDWLEITWPKPSKKVQRIASPPMDRYMTVTEAG